MAGSGKVSPDQLPKDLKLAVNADESEDICMLITNHSSESADLRLSFVDATITNDLARNKACKDETEKSNFWRFVDWPENSFSVPGGATVEKHATLRFPGWFAGESYGCVTYYFADALETESSSMFKIMVRRANFIEAVVSWSIDLGLVFVDDLPKELVYTNLSVNSNVNVYYDESANGMLVHFGLKNIGTVAEYVVITWTISNVLGFQYTFTQDSRKILPKESIIFREVVEGVPFYKGPFTVDINVSYVPQFEFVSDNITEDMKQYSYLFESVELFLFSWPIIGLCALVLVIVLIIIMILRRRKKKEKNSIKKSIKKKKKSKIHIKK